MPLAPGAGSTFTVAYTIAPDSVCGAETRIDFYSYLYYEYQAGEAKNSGIIGIPGTQVACA